MNWCIWCRRKRVSKPSAQLIHPGNIACLRPPIREWLGRIRSQRLQLMRQIENRTVPHPRQWHGKTLSSTTAVDSRQTAIASEVMKSTCCICDPRIPINPYVCPNHKQAAKELAVQQGITYEEAAGLLYLDALNSRPLKIPSGGSLLKWEIAK